MSTRLSELQARVLKLLAGIEPAWTLTGGAALAGFHLGHRTTRDLDLFWHGQTSIDAVRREVTSRLTAAGLLVDELRSSAGFASLRVRNAQDVVLVDLVAEPVAHIEAPSRIVHQGTTIQVDTPHEILVNKLCALLHRSEVRDLVDIAALVAQGGDLDNALRDAPRKDGGFSGVTLGWTLSTWRVADAARVAGFGDRSPELEQLRDQLVRRAAGRTE